MKKELYIQIPEPCHEDWSKMTPVQQGRYCQSCCKEVVDFSLMTDQEIISFLSKPRGKTCGNFSSDQLNRVIKEPATPAKKRLWAVMLSFLLPVFVSSKSKAQVLGKVKASTSQQPALYTNIVGDTVISATHKLITVYGKVTDEQGNPIEAATVIIRGTKIGTAADNNGNYKLIIPSSSNPKIQISAVSFHLTEITLSTFTDSIKQDVILNRSSEFLGGKLLLLTPDEKQESKLFKRLSIQ